MIRLFLCLVGDDYSVISGELEFQPSTNPEACSNDVSILQDTLLETVEIFFLSLRSSDQSVILSPTLSQIQITILDDDSELTGVIFTILAVLD